MKVIGSSSLIALLFAASFVAPAAAGDAKAPGYVSSDPAEDEMVQQTPEKVEIIFSEPLDATSKLIVTDACGNRVDDDMPVIRANVMSIGIVKKQSGKHKVSYLAKGLGGLTGEQKGKFNFMVHRGPVCDPDAAAGGMAGMPGMDDGSGGNDPDGSGSPHSSMGGDPSMDSPTMSGMGGMAPATMTGAPMTMAPMANSPMKASSMDRMDMSDDGGGGPGKHVSMNDMDDEQAPALAAGPGGLTVPDGQAVTMALAMSLMVGVVGGWFLRVTGAR